MWGEYTIEPNKLYEVKLGTLLYLIRLIGDELHYAVDNGDKIGTMRPLRSIRWKKEYEEIEWSRCIVYDTPVKVRITPVLPDKPVIVRTLTMIQIPGNKETRFYLQMPSWLRVELIIRRGPDVLLGDYATEVLSQSWFGDPVSGEPCYALRTRAVRDLELLSHDDHLVTCGLTIKNGYYAPLTFERINLQVIYMSVFNSTERLWTNAAGVLFRGPDQVSQLNFSHFPPSFVNNPVKLSKERQKMSRNLMRKSFIFLKKMTGLDED